MPSDKKSDDEEVVISSEKSVLRKKLDGKSTTSSGVKNMSSLWGEIKKETLKTVGEALGRDITSATHTMGKQSLQKFRTGFDTETTFYHLGTSMEVFAALIYFSPSLASMMTEKKLAADGEEEPDEATPGLLDLYLLQPVAQQLIDGMRRAFEAVMGPEDRPELVLRDQFLSLEDLKGIEEDNDLFQYTLNISEDGGGDHFIGLCFPYAALEKISLVSKNRMAASELDPNDPWVGHMRSAVLQAKLPLSIVLESCSMSVAECSRFKVNQVIQLPGVSLSDLVVKAETRAGKVNIARSQLGIFKQFKAVKLHDDLDRDFIMDLPNLITA